MLRNKVRILLVHRVTTATPSIWISAKMKHIFRPWFTTIYAYPCVTYSCVSREPRGILSRSGYTGSDKHMVHHGNAKCANSPKEARSRAEQRAVGVLPGKRLHMHVMRRHGIAADKTQLNTFILCSAREHVSYMSSPYKVYHGSSGPD